MTAINVVRAVDRIYVLTDGAFIDQDGVLVEIGQKVSIFPYLRAVLAYRGAVEFATAVQLQVAAAAPQSWEQLVEVLPGCVAEAVGSIPDMPGRGEVIAAGISFDRQQTEVFGIFTEAFAMPAAGIDVEAFEVFAMPDIVAAPVPLPPLLDEFGVAPFAPDAFNPYQDGLRLMEAQRRVPHSDGRGYFIGGMANLNTVTVNGVNSEILIHWADKLGQKIVPGN